MKKYWIAATALLAVSTAHAEPELKGTPPELTQYLINEKKVMTLTADGEVRVQADKAVATLQVKNKDATFAGALRNNRALRDKLKQRLIEAKIAEGDITFAKFSSVPSYGFFGDKPSSYEISNEVTVTVRNDDEVTAIALAVDAMKEVSFGGIEFQDSQKKKNETQATDLALQELKSRQTQFEKNLNLNLTLMRVERDVVMPFPIRSMPRAHKAVSSFSGGANEMMISQDAPALEEPAAQAAFGTIIYRAYVTGEFMVK